MEARMQELIDNLLKEDSLLQIEYDTLPAGAASAVDIATIRGCVVDIVTIAQSGRYSFEEIDTIGECRAIIYNKWLVFDNAKIGGYEQLRVRISNLMHYSALIANLVDKLADDQQTARLGYSMKLGDVSSYGHKPRARLLGNCPHNLYLGLELEIELCEPITGPNYHRSAIGQFSHYCDNMFYAKTDASLTNGVEIVSHPATIEYWKSVRPGLAKALQACVIIGYRGGESGVTTAGLHIHLSRAAFKNTWHLYRFVAFHAKNWEFIHLVSQREQISGYASYNDMTGKDREQLMRKTKGSIYGASRYSAINLNNEHTVECRYFRSNLRPERVYKALQFVHALFVFTTSHSAKQCEQLTPFLNWLAKRPGEYPDLTSFLQETRQAAAIADFREREKKAKAKPKQEEVSGPF